MIKELVTRELLLGMITQSINDLYDLEDIAGHIIKSNNVISALEVNLYMPSFIGLAIHKTNASFINLHSLDWLYTSRLFRITLCRIASPHKIILIDEYEKRLLELIEQRRSI